MSTPTTTTFPGRYLSITSYKRDRSAVRTPVWFVEEDGRLLVQTDIDSGKVKRIRNHPSVEVAPCTASGRPRGAAHVARAEIVEAPEVLEHIEKLIGRKYRRDLPLIKAGWWVKRGLHLGRQRGAMVGLSITPDDGRAAV